MTDSFLDKLSDLPYIAERLKCPRVLDFISPDEALCGWKRVEDLWTDSNPVQPGSRCSC